MRRIIMKKSWGKQLGVGLLAVTLGLTLPAAGWSQQGDKTVSLNFKDADIRDVIETLSNEAGFNYTMDPGVSGRVTCSLQDVTVEEALELILAQNNCIYEKKGNVYVIKPKPKPEPVVNPKVAQPPAPPPLPVAKPPAARKEPPKAEKAGEEAEEGLEEAKDWFEVSVRYLYAPSVAMLFPEVGTPLMSFYLNPLGFGGGGFGGGGFGGGGFGSSGFGGSSFGSRGGGSFGGSSWGSRSSGGSWGSRSSGGSWGSRSSGGSSWGSRSSGGSSWRR